MEVKGAPVQISTSGSPPTGDGSDHQIIRPTPRRATEIVNSTSGNEPPNIVTGGHLESVDLYKTSKLIQPTSSAPFASLSFSTTTSYTTIYPENQQYSSHKPITSKDATSNFENRFGELDLSPRRISRNNSQTSYVANDKQAIVNNGSISTDKPQSYSPSISSLNKEISTKNDTGGVSVQRKASSSSPKGNNECKVVAENDIIKANNQFTTNKNEFIQSFKNTLKEDVGKHLAPDTTYTHQHEQIPVRDMSTDTKLKTKEGSIIPAASTTDASNVIQNVTPNGGGLVTNVLVDGTHTSSADVPPAPTQSSISDNKLSSVMYVQNAESIIGRSSITKDAKTILPNLPANTPDDSGYQILSSRDEEAERDPQNSKSPNKSKKDLKQGRSSLAKYNSGYKPGQSRNKPKRKPLGGPHRSRVHHNVKSGPGGHFHSTDANADDKLSRSLENANRLLDVKNAIEQLKLRSSHHQPNYSNPAYSSNDNDDNSSTSSYSSATDDSDDIVPSVLKGGGSIISSVSTSASLPVLTASLSSIPPSTTSAFPSSHEQAPFQPAHHKSNDPIHMGTSGGSGMILQDNYSCKEGGGGALMSQRNTTNKRSNSNNITDEAHNTTVTSADEFVWIDSYNRLVELQKFPWNHTDIFTVISAAQNGRDISTPGLASSPGGAGGGLLGGGGSTIDSPEHRNLFLSADILPRLSYYLQRALVRIAREAQRLSKVTMSLYKFFGCINMSLLLLQNIISWCCKFNLSLFFL